MHSPSFAVFSAHLGALLALVCASGYDGWANRSLPSRGASVYFVMSLCTSLLGSGWIEQALGVPSDSVAAQTMPWVFAVLMLATAMAGIGGARRWLGFPWRGQHLDRPMRGVLYALRLGVAITAGLAVAVWLARLQGVQAWQGVSWGSYAQWVIAVSAGLAVWALVVCSYVCYRIAQLSDRLSLWLTAATLLTVPGILGLALHQSHDWQAHWSVWALLVSLHTVAMLCTAVAAFKQNQMHNARERAESDAGNFDALDRVGLGERLVGTFSPKFDRLHQAGTAPAVLVVNVFNHDDIASVHGAAAVDQVTLATLARLRTVLNPHDLLARYFDGCFVVLIRAEVDTHYLREVALRLAASVCRDVALRGLSAVHNDHTPLVLDVGVGVCWSDRAADFQTALREAGAASAAARNQGSHASVVIYPGHPALPVEVVLGGVARASAVA